MLGKPFNEKAGIYSGPLTIYDHPEFTFFPLFSCPDVYSFGVCVWEIIVREDPYQEFK